MPPPDTLYHYCDNEAFASIFQHKTIRLSSLKQSNDSKEGQLVLETMVRLADQDRLSQHKLDQLQLQLSLLTDRFDSLGFCLSAENDLLSQWRGYADDGKGIAIGFRRSYLEELASTSVSDVAPGFRLGEVLYLPEEHEQVLRPAYEEMLQLIPAAPTGTSLAARTVLGMSEFEREERIAQSRKTQKSLSEKALELLPLLFKVKSKSFKEEREWRLVSLIWGEYFQSCHFRSKGNKLIPYRDFGLKPFPDGSITEIWLGPKNDTPKVVIEAMLAKAGQKSAQVKLSESSYR